MLCSLGPKFVDDILIMENDDSAIGKFKEYLHLNFHIEDLRPPKYFLEIAIARSNKGYVLVNKNLSRRLYQK